MLLTLTLALLAGACVAAPPFPRKQLSGPPEEFASHSIPSTLKGAITSHSANFRVYMAPNSNGGLSWSTAIPMDSNLFEISVFAPQLAAMRVSLLDPKGKEVDLSKKLTEAKMPVGDSEEYLTGNMYTVLAAHTGTYTLTLTATSEFVRNSNSQQMDAFVTAASESLDIIFTHLTSSYLSLTQGQTVGLAAKMTNQNMMAGREIGFNPAVLNDTIASAELLAIFPDGSTLKEPMHDDGLHGDGLANDGEYGATFTATEVGPYIIQAGIQGQNMAGNYIRTALHYVEVVPQYASLIGKATGTINSNTQRMYVNLLLNDAASASADVTLRGYFQLWGTANGQATPIAWSSSLVNVQQTSAGPAVTLEVDLAWLHRAGISQGPFTLQDVYISEMENLVPLSHVDSMALVLDNEDDLKVSLKAIAASGYNGTITKVMREGIPPARNSSADATTRLILLHGYCSDGNPWLKETGVWPSDALYFMDPKQSRSHDAFANLVMQFAQDNGVEQFVVVGHSQGGIVGAHLLNYYFSGMDAITKPGRLHTSLGSPYLGCNAAGDAADLADMLGGCGRNNDMTPDGAANWASGISTATWPKVHFYRTQYKESGLFQNCNALIQNFITKPNDGVTEVKFTVPSPLANDHGLTYGECHVDGMKYPASFRNQDRNREIRDSLAL